MLEVSVVIRSPFQYETMAHSQNTQQACCNLSHSAMCQSVDRNQARMMKKNLPTTIQTLAVFLLNRRVFKYIANGNLVVITYRPDGTVW